MRNCYISYHLVQKYLSYVTVKGLLFRDPRSNKYYVTSKGIQYLDYFDEYLHTESTLVHKKNLISDMLDERLDSRTPVFKTRTNTMLLQTAA